jgi:hypothetical protein
MLKAEQEDRRVRRASMEEASLPSRANDTSKVDPDDLAIAVTEDTQSTAVDAEAIEESKEEQI